MDKSEQDPDYSARPPVVIWLSCPFAKSIQWGSRNRYSVRVQAIVAYKIEISKIRMTKTMELVVVPPGVFPECCTMIIHSEISTRGSIIQEHGAFMHLSTEKQRGREMSTQKIGATSSLGSAIEFVFPESINFEAASFPGLFNRKELLWEA